ncbi:spermatogenesis associated 6-like protein [Ciconia maguari]
MTPGRSRVSLLGVPCVGPLPCRRRAGHLPGGDRRTLTNDMCAHGTCPGVFLPEKHDVFLSVCILGQHKVTECLPPVFPLLFHEKMCFEKVFESAIDPAAVLEMLESNVTKFALTQLVSSGNKQVQKHSVILEKEDAETQMRQSVIISTEKPKQGQKKSVISAPSLNTRDHICELCRENQHQLSRLSLGSAECKSENENRPPFVVRHLSPKISVGLVPDFPSGFWGLGFLKDSFTASSFDNCEASNTSVKMIKEPSEQATSEHDSSSLGTDGPVSYLRYPPSQRDSVFHRAASSATSQHLKSPSPVGTPPAFQNRLLILNQSSYLGDVVL